MDLDPASWGGLELGLKIGPVKTSRYDMTIMLDTVTYRVVHKFCNKLKCEYLPMKRLQNDKICRDCV